MLPLPEAGLAGVGFASAEPFVEARQALEERKASGLHGGLGFTYADPARAADPRASVPWAESLVVAAHAYLPVSGSPGPASPGTGRVARFATGDHYAPLRAGLAALAGVLEGGRLAHRDPVRRLPPGGPGGGRAGRGRLVGEEHHGAGPRARALAAAGRAW